MNGAKQWEQLTLAGVTVLLAVTAMMTAYYLGVSGHANPADFTEASSSLADVKELAPPADQESVSAPDGSEETRVEPTTEGSDDSAAMTPAQGAKPLCAVVMCAALTFDDGPDAQSTTQLLDLLHDEGVTASFFMVGRKVATHPQIAQRMVADGHEVANHSWSHPELNKLGNEAVNRQLDRTSAAIEKHTGITPALMRPPYGATNGRVKGLISGAGMTQTLWSVDTLDWKHRDPAQTLARVQRDTTPNAVILMHDVHPTTVDAVRGVIQWLRGEGYTLVTTSEIAEMIDVSTLESPD